MNPIMKEIVRLLDSASPEKQRSAWVLRQAMTQGERK